MPISKLSDKNRLLGASLKNLNPTAIYNKVNEVVDTTNYNFSQVIANFVGDFTIKNFIIKYSNLVGVISVGDEIVGNTSGAIGKVYGVTANTITFKYDPVSTKPFLDGEGIVDSTSGATAILGVYIQNNYQEITLKGGNRYIITDVLFYDSVNIDNIPEKLSVSGFEFVDDKYNNYYIGNSLDLNIDTVLYSSIFGTIPPVIVNTNKLYLNVAGIDSNYPGYAKIKIYGIALD